MPAEPMHALTSPHGATTSPEGRTVQLDDWVGGFPSRGESFDAIPATEEECLHWYQPLLASMVRRYARQQHPVLTPEDVLQEASLGLIQAYRKFDPTRGVFAPFAQQCVYSAIMDLLRRADNLSTHHRHKLRALPEWFSDTASRRQPTDEEFALACASAHMSPHEARILLSATRTTEIPVHISAQDELLDSLSHSHNPVGDPESSVDLRDIVQRQMNTWLDRDREIFLSAVLTGKKQAELAQDFRLTQARISQITSRCWNDLFTALNDHQSAY